MNGRLNMSRPHRDRWLISYADLVTLLFASFTTAYAASYAAQEAPASPPPPEVVVQAADTTEADVDVVSTDEEEQPEAGFPADATADAIRDAVGPLRLAVLGDAEVDVMEDARGLVISLPEAATFATGSAVLSSGARDFLLQFAARLHPTGAHVRVEGHTDDVPVSGGRYGSNWELSTARASAVVLFLIEHGALEPARLSAAGYAEHHPRVPNATPEARARNRRVDLVVVAGDAPAAPEDAEP